MKAQERIEQFGTRRHLKFYDFVYPEPGFIRFSYDRWGERQTIDDMLAEGIEKMTEANFDRWLTQLCGHPSTAIDPPVDS